MFNPSTITIERSAYASNLSFIKAHLNGARMCSVVKGNAYGHGLKAFVPMAMEAGVDYFGVYSADEAHALLRSVEDRPDVFVMGMVDDDALDWAVEQGVECCIQDLARLERALVAASRTGRPARMHIEIETGMHRTGFTSKEIPQVISLLREHASEVELVGLFTHFAGAESSVNDDRVGAQIARYASARGRFERSGLIPRYAHQACSAAAMNFPGTIGNMARIGIMQYGFWPNPETWLRYSLLHDTPVDPLRRTISWKSAVMALTDVPVGGMIGYGTSCEALRDMCVAVVPVGYAHGFDRGLSNTGRVLIRGQIARVTGIVNMNAISVDVTDIEGVEKGDEVVLIGHQEEQSISVASFSELSEQLNYGMLTRLPSDIPRLVIDRT
ncbi:MAG: alanine racemase [Flavobacteriales bacterium]|nr:alanine racemase [Flavobacteriales bacterium]